MIWLVLDLCEYPDYCPVRLTVAPFFVSFDLMQKHAQSWFHPVVVGLAAICALALIFSFCEIYSPDIGFHLSLGQWIANHGQVPRTDPLTYTLTGRPHIDLQWFFQLGVACVYRIAGTAGLAAGTAGLMLFTFTLLVWRSWRRERAVTLAWAVPLLLFALGPSWEIRPHLASWIGLNAILLGLETYRRDRGNPRVLWFLPPIMAIWANTHSLFILGLVGIGCYAAAELPRGIRAAAPLLVAGAVSTAACLLTPYGLGGFLFPFTQFIMIQDASVFKSAAGINEFDSPLDLTAYTANRALVLYQPLLFMQAYGVLALAAFAFAWRRVNLPERIIFVLFAYLFWSAQKNFGYFVVATYPVVVIGLRQAAALATCRIPPATARLLRPAVLTGCITACAIAAIHAMNGYAYALQRLPQRPGHRFNPDLLPVRAAAFLRNAPIPPVNMLNSFGDGGYLGFASGRKVFIDGRAELAGPAFFQRWSGLGSPDRLAATIREFGIRLAVVPFNSLPSWFQFFETTPGWRRVYADDRDLVYCHASLAPEVPTVAPFRAGIDYRVYPPEEMDRILERATHLHPPGWLGSLCRRHCYPLPQLRQSGYLMLTGQPQAALGVGLAGLEQSTFPAYDLLANVGHAFWAIGDRPRAATCYRAVLDSGAARYLGRPLEQALHARLAEMDAKH